MVAGLRHRKNHIFLRLRLLGCGTIRTLDFDDALPDSDIALRRRDLDPGFAEFFLNGKVDIAAVTPWPIAHFAAPHDEFEIDRAFSKFVQKYTRRGILQRIRIFPPRRQERLPDFINIAAVSDANRNAKTHSGIAVSPICHRRINKLRIGDNHRDVVIGANHRAARANLLDLTGNTRHLDAVADCDRAFGQDDEAADKVTGDILQAEADADAHRARKNSQGAEVNTCILEHDENADDEHHVGDDLRDCVLEGTVETTVDQKSIEQKSLCARRDPEYDHQQRDEQEDLNEAERDARQGLTPRQWNSSGVDCADSEKDQRGQAQNCCDNRDEIGVDFEPGEKAADSCALQCAGHEQTGAEKRYKRDQAEKRNIVAADVKEGPFKNLPIHRF